MDQLRTANTPSLRQPAPRDPHFDPCPGGARPHLEQDTAGRQLLVHASIERDTAVPRTRGNRWAPGELLALRLCLFILVAPFREVAHERAGRAERGMDGGAPEHDGKRDSDGIRQGHHRVRVSRGRMGEPLQGGERLLTGKIEDARMCLDDREIEGRGLVEEFLGRAKPGRMLWLMVECLFDGFRGLYGLCRACHLVLSGPDLLLLRLLLLFAIVRAAQALV